MSTKIAHTYSTFSDCCQELLEESEVNSDNCFDRIVTGDETWIYCYDPLSQRKAKVWKKPGEEIPTQLRRRMLAERIMTLIFWDKHSILLAEYLPLETTMSGPYYI